MGFLSTLANSIPGRALGSTRETVSFLRGRHFLVWALALLVLPVASQAAETLYVSSAEATLRSEPSFSGEPLGKLPQGAELRRLEAQGNWVKVSHEQGEGWLSELLVTANKPTRQASGALGSEQPEIRNPRRRSSSVTTAAAARGLAGEAQAQSGQVQGDMAGVERMSAMTPSSDEVDAFLKGLR